MKPKTLRRSLLQRIRGIPATEPPHDPACWTFADGKVRIDLQRAPELHERSGALRLENPSLPERVLVMLGEDGRYHAYRNACTHGGRCFDPVPNTFTVQCCSLGRSTYDYDGRVLSGPARGCLRSYPVQRTNGTLIVDLSSSEHAVPGSDRTTADI